MTQSSQHVLVECIDSIEIFHAKLRICLILLRSHNFISILYIFCSKIVRLIMKCSSKMIKLFAFFFFFGTEVDGGCGGGRS